MIEPKTLERITPAIVRRLRDAMASCPVTVHVKLEDAIKLIDAQAKEIERLRRKEQAK
jgi:hypothetical protein